MNKSELISQVATLANVSKKESAAVIDATLDIIGTTLANKEKVQIAGFGTFETRNKGERTCRNPHTGETIKVPATTVPAFKPGKILKEKVK